MQNALKPNEWCKIWVFQIVKIEKKTWVPKNSAVLQDWFTQEIKCPHVKLEKSLKN